MQKVQKTYTPEFKREAVQLAQTSGKLISQIARELGISDTRVHQWRKELAEHASEAFPGSGHQQEKLLRLYDKASEGAAYGTYAHRLFQPVQEQFKHAGFRSSPNFPGTLSTSREWGPPQERERWMWSVVRQRQGAPLGTIVIQLVHDHTQFRLPHPPGVLALEETDTNAIVQAVSQAAGHPESGEE